MPSLFDGNGGKVIRERYPKHLSEFIFSLNTGLRLSSQYARPMG
jgi:hypothetical protein